MENKTFNKGDFIKYESYCGNEKTTFGIFEGVDLQPEYQYTKKYSLVLFYDSYKYCSDKVTGVYGYRPSLDVARDGKGCEKTIDTLEEDSWWKHCTQYEKEKAIEILAQHGYEWDEELLELRDIDTKEIVHKIITPKIEYLGNKIKPMNVDFKEKLKKAVVSKNKTSYSPQYNYNDYWD